MWNCGNMGQPRVGNIVFSKYINEVLSRCLSFSSLSFFPFFFCFVFELSSVLVIIYSNFIADHQHSL